MGGASEMTEGVAIVRVGKTLLGPRLLIHGGLKWRWFWWQIYSAPTAEAAEQELEAFARQWDASHPTISQIWRRNWARIIPFFAFSPEIRKVIYTINAVESLNMTLRKVIKTRAAFPTEEAALKLLYLALQNVAKKWHTVQGWREALNRFQILWPERMPALERV